ncbi:uncharacterized protein PV09_00667 [Verruconis gallopava]|jgi:hypothetical protein|uniref:Uncharacterized protein n=1 Tax=Verruconis gallopava TaxID=253628 RepID=A0A0D2BBJ6_9PEZI|nr:uncharacterized protein PV09_00667 [Verruconis gallopava]KIW08724.1 hypothetical protein PV09_00667 [Verruconis gallopava]
MATLQLSFTLRTTAQCKSVHLLGSWDGYQGQLPLSRDTSKSAGNWTGTFRFTGGTLQQGQRYWYYYIMDGYHCTHDPAKQSVLEPTTQRKLNILDVPAGSAKTTSSKRSSRRTSKEIPQGRGVAREDIKCPKPYNPAQTANIVAQGYNQTTVDELTARFGYANMDDDSEIDSDADSDVPSLTSSRSSNSSSPSSVASDASSCCTCERYGITRSGNRVKLDCGGSRCGYSDDDSDCASEYETEYKSRATRRHGVVIRA